MNNPKRMVCNSSARAITYCIPLIATAWIYFAVGCRLIPNESSSRSGHYDLSAEPIFRDDFIGQLDAAWEWENEDASRHKVSEDGWLEITGGDESLISGGQQTNLLWTALPGGNFEISIRLKAQPLFDYQRVGILLYQDSGNYISLSHGNCLQCVLGGEGVILEYNLIETQGRFSTAIHTNDLRLMLVVEQGSVSAFYAIEENRWQHLASLENAINFERVAVNVTNGSKWDEGYDLIGRFDYFEIRRPTQSTPTPTPNGLHQAWNFKDATERVGTNVTALNHQ